MENNFITIESSHGGGTLERCLSPLDRKIAAHLEYSKNGYSWKPLTMYDPLHFSTVHIRGKCHPETEIGSLVITDGDAAVSGNIMNLVDYNNPNNVKLFPQVFGGVFYDSRTLCTAEELELPAAALADRCYKSMFGGCTSLTTAPELPATTLAESCYSGMFGHCTSLTTAPALPATTLAECCYSGMFYDCTSLTTAPGLPATNLAKFCYECMFEGCTSLITAPELPATTLVEGCYNFMFRDCTNLIIKPDIPALTPIERKKYAHCMFRGCSRKYLTHNEFCNHFNTMFKNGK